MGKFHFLLIKRKMSFKYKKAGWDPDQMPGVAGNETVLHVWRSRRQKGGPRPAGASAGFVLVPCHGAGLWLAERGGHDLGPCCWLQIAWACPWPYTGWSYGWVLARLGHSFLPPELPCLATQLSNICSSVLAGVSLSAPSRSWSLILEGRELVVSSILVSVICSLSSLFFFFPLRMVPNYFQFQFASSKKDNSEALSSEC